MTSHTVSQGEHLARIAQQYGFTDLRVLWEHPGNAELKRKRGSPHVLLPGDVVFIPERQDKSEPRPAGAFHRFQRSGSRLKLRLVLRDFDGRPLPNARCLITVEDQPPTEIETDADGLLEVPLPGLAERGRLTVPALGIAVPLLIGHLDPVEADSGVRARLLNLGYLADSPGAEAGAALRGALEEFQCDHGMPVTGAADATTRARLLAVHGS